MNHHTTADFWDCYGRLPAAVQRLADANYDLLRADRSLAPIASLQTRGPAVVGACREGLPGTGRGWRRWAGVVLDRVACRV